MSGGPPLRAIDSDESTDDELADAMRKPRDLLSRIAIGLDHDDPLRRAYVDLAGALQLRAVRTRPPGPPRGAHRHRGGEAG